MVQVMGRLILWSALILVTGCFVAKPTVKSPVIGLEFLDEYVNPAAVSLDSTVIGGLSGIDFANGNYYLIVDDPKTPRYYQAKIEISNAKIDTVIFTKTVFIEGTPGFLDMEAIRFNAEDNTAVISTEGHINSGKDPMVFSVDSTGKVLYSYILPDYFMANSTLKPRHNGVFEGLCESYDKKGYWVAMELPLEKDGPEPTTKEGHYPVRITYLDKADKRAKKQFVYLLDEIELVPKGRFAVNGLTDILEYGPDRFLVLERSFSSGWGTQGNVVKIYKADASGATNTLQLPNISENEVSAARKELLFDFNTVRNRLTENSIDNIEGFTFGPDLPDGSKILILVSDNNFNRLGKQLNQFILMKIVEKL